ncbi:MAG: SRPBCC family protein [Actinomycetes bacterium]
MAEQTESSIVIASAPAQVIAVIADFDAYPVWSGEVQQAEVESRGPDGRPERVRFVLDSGAIRDTYTLGYEWDGDHRVSWHLVKAGMLTALDGSYLLEPVAEGTQVTYRLVVDVRFPMIGLIKRKAEKVIVDRALKGLAARVESLAG